MLLDVSRCCNRHSCFCKVSGAGDDASKCLVKLGILPGVIFQKQTVSLFDTVEYVSIQPDTADGWPLAGMVLAVYITPVIAMSW